MGSLNERVRDAVAKGHEKVENLQKSGKLEELGEGINKLAANAGKLKEGIKGKLENVKLPGGIKLPTTPVTSTPTGAPLPAGWAWAKDGDGVPYYFNKSTNVVTYEDPRKGPPPPPPPPPPEEPEAAVDVSDAAGGGGGEDLFAGTEDEWALSLLPIPRVPLQAQTSPLF